MRIITSTIMAMAIHCGVVTAEDDWTIEYLPVDEVTATSDDGRVSLRVKIQRFKRNELRHEVIEHKELDHEDRVYAGKERLPIDVLYYRPCLVREFELSIDGKRIELPDNLWKDVGGFSLSKLQDLPKKPNDAQKMMHELELEEPGLRPQIRYSDKDDNYMIIWERGADCDQRHTMRWIISKDGKTIMRHLDIPPHHC